MCFICSSSTFPMSSRFTPSHIRWHETSAQLSICPIGSVHSPSKKRYKVDMGVSPWNPWVVLLKSIIFEVISGTTKFWDIPKPEISYSWPPQDMHWDIPLPRKELRAIIMVVHCSWMRSYLRNNICEFEYFTNFCQVPQRFSDEKKTPNLWHDSKVFRKS